LSNTVQFPTNSNKLHDASIYKLHCWSANCLLGALGCMHYVFFVRRVSKNTLHNAQIFFLVARIFPVSERKLGFRFTNVRALGLLFFYFFCSLAFFSIYLSPSSTAHPFSSPFFYVTSFSLPSNRPFLPPSFLPSTCLPRNYIYTLSSASLQPPSS
jgi:hypothetical protein